MIFIYHFEILCAAAEALGHLVSKFYCHKIDEDRVNLVTRLGKMDPQETGKRLKYSD